MTLLRALLIIWGLSFAVFLIACGGSEVTITYKVTNMADKTEVYTCKTWAQYNNYLWLQFEDGTNLCFFGGNYKIEEVKNAEKK